MFLGQRVTNERCVELFQTIVDNGAKGVGRDIFLHFIQIIDFKDISCVKIDRILNIIGQ